MVLDPGDHGKRARLNNDTDTAMPMKITRTICLAAILAAACASSDGPSGDTSARSDSAGITIITSSQPAWQKGHEWTLSAEPILQIGSVDGDTLYQLDQAHSALRLSDGRIGVANMGTSQLRYFDANGKFIKNVGREGQGPGEWDQLYQLRRGAGDSLLVVEPANEHSVISPAGVYLDRFSLEPVDRRDNIWGLGRLSGGFMLAYSLAPPPDRLRYSSEVSASGHEQGPTLGPNKAPEGFYREEYQHFLYDMKGRMIDSLGLLPGGSEYGGNMQGAFPTRGFYAVNGDRLFFGTGNTHEIRVYRFDISDDIGNPAASRLAHPEKRLVSMILERMIRRTPDNSLRLTPEVKAQYLDAERKRWQTLLDKGHIPAGVSIELQLEHIAFPDSIPAQERLLTDSEKNIWEQRYKLPGDTLDTFAIFDEAGVWQGRIVMPPRFRVSDIGADYVLGIWRDDDDVQFIRMYKLIKP